MKKAILLIMVPALVLGSALVWIVSDLQRYARTPANPNAPALITTIRSGEGLAAVSANLQRKGLIKSPLRLRLLARYKGVDKQIKAGEYRLAAAMTPAEILAILVAGKVVLHRVTIPEGLNLRQTARLVDDSLPVTEAEFMAAVTGGALLHKYGPGAESLEGYLFPDTYHFAKGTPAEKVVATMAERLRTVFSPQWQKRASEIGFSIHKVLTLASIIEKETGQPDERKLISSVFHNRLRRGMRLESDPTVIYGIADFNGNLTRKDLKTKTPYNTYRIKGLPPGPIASPGAASIEAALYPAATGYLYFVSKRDRSHQFSNTLADHNRAVRKYQLHR